MGTDIDIKAAETKPITSVRLELFARVVLVVVAVAVSGLSVWVSLPATALAVAVTAEWAARRRQRGVVDALAVAAAGVVVTAVLLGLLLNLLPTGLTLRSWSLGGGVAALIVLGLGAIRPVPRSVWGQLAPHLAAQRTGRKPFGAVVVINGLVALIAVLIVAGALAFSGNSASANATAPLEMSAITSGTQVQVTINSGASAGPFDLLVINGVTTTTVASGLEVNESNSLVVLVTVAPTGRTLIELVAVGGTEPLRELIFDHGVLTSVPPQ